MKSYEKPMAVTNDELSESVYLASGDKNDDNSNDDNLNIKTCRFGRRDANPGADKCQACSKSGGLSVKLEESTFISDFTQCVDNMPVKK